jgi:hypothetical protein
MKRSLLALTLVLSGCYTYQPPEPASPRDATAVGATAGETWDAVIDLFAARNIPIRTIEKASGLIASDQLTVDPAEGPQWADCGELGNNHFYPNEAVYNVVVRGDSAGALVRTTVRWTHRTGGDDPDRDCATTHAWEQSLESEVKARAEWRHAQAPATTFGYEAPPATAGGGYSPPESQGASVPPPPAKPRRGVEPPRNRSELLAYPTFREVVEDGRRLGIVSEFQEIRRDTLDVELREGRDSSPRTSYYLGRLFAAYRGTTDWSRRTCLELWWDGKPIGLYNSAGLTWE